MINAGSNAYNKSCHAQLSEEISNDRVKRAHPVRGHLRYHHGILCSLVVHRRKGVAVGSTALDWPTRVMRDMAAPFSMEQSPTMRWCSGRIACQSYVGTSKMFTCDCPIWWISGWKSRSQQIAVAICPKDVSATGISLLPRRIVLASQPGTAIVLM